MNSVALTHLVAAVIAAIAAVPLIKRRVKMNHWYGVRIPAAFVSDEAWFELNAYGGRLLLVWAAFIATMAIVGLLLPARLWPTYRWVSLVMLLGGLVVVIASIYRRGAKRG